MRIARTLLKLKENGNKALSLFVTPGYPAMQDTVPLILGLAKSGADIIEIGIPFSDPIADGPTIQQSSEAALGNGVTLAGIFGFVREIRKETDLPLVLMGYANPVYSYGMDRFLGECASGGIDGTIIADLPLEESAEYVSAAKERGVSTIFLAAPTTPPARLAELDRISSGFLYCISITGVTGERTALAGQAEGFLRSAREAVKNNALLVGFGISTPDDARRVAEMSDGVIIGSALIKTLRDAPPGRGIERACDFVRSIRKALDTH
ncbi:MAG TPA: tryptophan synthase subunit alpha [Bacteroidota bacterium]|jgi:tryptophan synthase alpha chain